MNKQIERGQAPKSMDRADAPHNADQLPHVHFKDNAGSLNNDGTIGHSGNWGRALTNAEMDWLKGNNWKLPSGYQ